MYTIILFQTKPIKITYKINFNNTIFVCNYISFNYVKWLLKNKLVKLNNKFLRYIIMKKNKKLLLNTLLPIITPIPALVGSLYLISGNFNFKKIDNNLVFENLAKQNNVKKVSASSSLGSNDNNHTPEKAIDNYKGSHWKSKINEINTTNNDNYYELEFKDIHTIRYLKLHFNTSNISHYKISLVDNDNNEHDFYEYNGQTLPQGIDHHIYHGKGNEENNGELFRKFNNIKKIRLYFYKFNNYAQISTLEAYENVVQMDLLEKVMQLSEMKNYVEKSSFSEEIKNGLAKYQSELKQGLHDGYFQTDMNHYYGSSITKEKYNEIIEKLIEWDNKLIYYHLKLKDVIKSKKDLLSSEEYKKYSSDSITEYKSWLNQISNLKKVTKEQYEKYIGNDLESINGKEKFYLKENINVLFNFLKLKKDNWNKNNWAYFNNENKTKYDQLLSQELENCKEKISKNESIFEEKSNLIINKIINSLNKVLTNKEEIKNFINSQLNTSNSDWADKDSEKNYKKDLQNILTLLSNQQEEISQDKNLEYHNNIQRKYNNIIKNKDVLLQELNKLINDKDFYTQDTYDKPNIKFKDLKSEIESLSNVSVEKREAYDSNIEMQKNSLLSNQNKILNHINSTLVEHKSKYYQETNFELFKSFIDNINNFATKTFKISRINANKYISDINEKIKELIPYLYSKILLNKIDTLKKELNKNKWMYTENSYFNYIGNLDSEKIKIEQHPKWFVNKKENANETLHWEEDNLLNSFKNNLIKDYKKILNYYINNPSLSNNIIEESKWYDISTYEIYDQKVNEIISEIRKESHIDENKYNQYLHKFSSIKSILKSHKSVLNQELHNEKNANFDFYTLRSSKEYIDNIEKLQLEYQNVEKIDLKTLQNIRNSINSYRKNLLKRISTELIDYINSKIEKLETKYYSNNSEQKYKASLNELITKIKSNSDQYTKITYEQNIKHINSFENILEKLSDEILEYIKEKSNYSELIYYSEISVNQYKTKLENLKNQIMENWKIIERNNKLEYHRQINNYANSLVSNRNLIDNEIIPNAKNNINKNIYTKNSLKDYLSSIDNIGNKYPYKCTKEDINLINIEIKRNREKLKSYLSLIISEAHDYKNNNYDQYIASNVQDFYNKISKLLNEYNKLDFSKFTNSDYKIEKTKIDALLNELKNSKTYLTKSIEQLTNEISIAEKNEKYPSKLKNKLINKLKTKIIEIQRKSENDFILKDFNEVNTSLKKIKSDIELEYINEKKINEKNSFGLINTKNIYNYSAYSILFGTLSISTIILTTYFLIKKRKKN